VALSSAKPQVYLACDMEDVACFEFAAGHACAFTTRSPDKESVNQDAVALLPQGEQAGVLVVADGLGGLPTGEKASAQAIESLRQSLSSTAGDRGLRERILDGLQRGNEAILAAGLGSATTVVVIEISAGVLRSYHAGDSAALVTGRQGKLKHHTIAHSPVGYAFEAGTLDEKTAMFHRDRHMISNVMGAADMSIDLGPEIELSTRDTVVLASDGLFDNLYVAEIVEIIRKGPLEGAARELRELCRARMLEQLPDQPHKADDLSFVLFRPAAS